MNTTTFSPDESIRLIQQMISKARTGLSANAKYFLLWGWAAFAACIAQFTLQELNYPHPYNVWLLMPVCAIITILMARRDNRHATVKTYIDEGMGYLWIGMGISFFVLALLFVKVGWQYCIPFFMLLYGLGTFISGKLLRFNAFTFGGILSFALAAIAVWFSPVYHPLFGAASLMACYIIPGHMLQNRISKTEKL